MSIPFEAFFEAVWGYDPYPWQSDLSRLAQTEQWPEVIDVPTGSGKTAVLDIALHHFIVDGGHVAPRRIMIVVDRRVIVDQAGAHAFTLLDALHSPEKAASPEKVAVLTKARDALRSIVGVGAPLLHTDVLRGGVVRSDAWAAYPHTPVLAGSTVDQLGSRLFFRGYGVSDRMQSIHAGLLGCDTLLLLDEVHLSRPFAEVLGQLEQIRRREGTSEIPRRFRVVQLSATPGKRMLGATVVKNSGAGSPEPLTTAKGLQCRSVVRLQDADHADKRLAKILQARKPATLERIDVRARSAEDVKRRAVAERAAHHSREMVREGRKAIAVVVNRVDTARRAWALLQDTTFDTVLITGRMRPLDQKSAIDRIEERVRTGRTANIAVRPILIVATQSIEAGADYDFDGLVTECAPLDALRQRFGRLDRKGDYKERPDNGAPRPQDPFDTHGETESLPPAGADSKTHSARAVILMRSDYLGNVVDPVYGPAVPRTWEWLTALTSEGSVDFGIDALEPHLNAAGEIMEEMLTPHRPAPVLLPAYLDQWAQTNPKPYADPDVSLFLHGIPEDARSALPDVQVVWRSDLSEADLEPGVSDSAQQALFDHLAIVPPGSLEAVSLPVWIVKHWLSGADRAAQHDDVPDIEGTAGPVNQESLPGRRVLLWRGRKRPKIIDASEIAPGVTIVVPESYGGIGPHGTFDPGMRSVPNATPGPGLVYDLGDAVQLRQRGSPSLRLDKRVLVPLVGQDVAAIPVPDADDENVELMASLGEWLRSLRRERPIDTPSWFSQLLNAIGDRPKLIPSPRKVWIALGRRSSIVGTDRSRASLVAPTSEVAIVPDATGGISDEIESFTGVRGPALLGDHLSGVGTLAERFAQHARLPPRIVASLKWAGRLHDVGKSDRRFQLWLHGGDEISARFGEVLAKSAIPWQSVIALREGRKRAQYPDGQRHELVSLDLIEQSPDLRARIESDAGDWELVLHLVAAHHGWCRPLAPVIALTANEGESVHWAVDGIGLEGSTAHRRDQLDSRVAARFWMLSRRYGRHELAYMEAILRLADHRHSEWEAEQ